MFGAASTENRLNFRLMADSGEHHVGREILPQPVMPPSSNWLALQKVRILDS